MMSHIEAIYRRGVFEPLEPVHLSDNQRVHLSVEPARQESALEWLDHVRHLQTKTLARHGSLPDSASDIATDRQR